MSSFIPLSESVIGMQFCQWCDDWRTMLAITYCDGETLYRCTSCQSFCDEPDWEDEYDEENEQPSDAGPRAWGVEELDASEGEEEFSPSDAGLDEWI